MKAKDFVLQKYPTARSERVVSGRVKGFKKVYYLIRERGEQMYLAQGTSESNAWVNAKNDILEEEKTTILNPNNNEKTS